MTEKNQNPMENLNDEQLEGLMQYTLPMKEENLEHIKERFLRQKNAHSKKQSKKILIAACIGFVFLAGFTQLDRMREVFQNFFGPESYYLTQYGEPIQSADIHNGIKMELIATLNDNGQNYTFLTLTDETGTRISKDTVIQNWEIISDSSNYGGVCQIIDYDDATKRATLLVMDMNAQPETEITFRLLSFIDGLTLYKTAPIELDIAGILETHEAVFTLIDPDLGHSAGWDEEQLTLLHLSLDHLKNFYQYQYEGDGTLYQYETGGGNPVEQLPERDYYGPVEAIPLLQTDVLNIPLTGFEKGTITNLAYNENFLRIQVKTAFDYDGSIDMYLQHTATGRMLPALYHISQQDVSDYVFYIESMEILEDYGIVVEGQYHNTLIEGTWETTFKTAKPIEAVPVADEILISTENGGRTLYDVAISPLSIHFAYKNEYSVIETEHGYMAQGVSSLSPDVVLYYKDGTAKEYNPLYVRASQGDDAIGQQTEQLAKEEIGGNIILLDSLEGFSLNGVYIPMPGL